MTRGLAWSLLATLCGVAGSLLVTPLLIHTLGAAQFGVYVLALALAGYAGFLDLGLTWAAGRYFAADLAGGRRETLRARFHTLARFLALVGAASVLLAVAVGPPVLRWAGAGAAADAVAALALAGLAFGLSLQAGLVGALLRAAQRFDEAGRVTVAAAALLPVAAWAAVRLAGTVEALLLGVALVNAVTLGLGWLPARTLLAPGPWRARWDTGCLREMLGFGGWSSLGRLVHVAMLQLDRLAVALIGSPAAVTYYAVPAALATRVNTLGGPLASLFFSRASLLHAGAETVALAQQHARATRLLVWATTAAVLPLVVLGDVFLREWIGPDMAATGGPALLALAVGYAVIAVASLDAVTLEAAGRADLTAISMGAWAIVAVLGTWAASGALGPLAVAVGVGGWLAGAGLTNMVLARRLVLAHRGPSGEARLLIGALLAAAVGALAGGAARLLVDSLLDALAGMALAGACALGAGWLVVLRREDRAALLARLWREAPGITALGTGRAAER